MFTRKRSRKHMRLLNLRLESATQDHGFHAPATCADFKALGTLGDTLGMAASVALSFQRQHVHTGIMKIWQGCRWHLTHGMHVFPKLHVSEILVLGILQTQDSPLVTTLGTSGRSCQRLHAF